MTTARQATVSSKPNRFYRDTYPLLVKSFVIIMLLVLVMVLVVFYQVYHRPLPMFNAHSSDGKVMTLNAYEEPNLQSNTLLKWASKAAVAAYTFDFVNYKKQIAAMRPYFTSDGWGDYQDRALQVAQDVARKQIFVNSVISGPPVISNQGELPMKGYVWRVQFPFLVTYQSSEATTQQTFTVLMTIVKVPTRDDPRGIGIDQFVMKG